MKHKSVPLFPIPISICNFGEDNHELNRHLIDDTFIEKNEDSTGQVRSNMGGWHSQAKLEDKYQSFATLRKQIEQQANIYCTQHGYEDGLVVQRLWANINETADINMPHHHGDASLTGVYYPVHYIDTNNECYFNYDINASIHPGTWNGKDGGSIVFFDPCYNQKTKLKKNKKPSPYTMSTYYTYPTSGLLVLFPSELVHMVTPFREKQKRLSISFVCSYK